MSQVHTDLINFFYEVGSLRILNRSYYSQMLQNTESIAEHSQRATIIAYLLAKKSKADPYKTMLMAAFHDIPETRIGDSNWLQKQYITQHEEKAWQAQLELMGPESDELKEIMKEYKERKTLESKIAKDADNIDYVLGLKELALTGNQEAQRRLGDRNVVDPNHLYTDLAKEIVEQILVSKPNEWFQKDIKQTHQKYLVK